MELTTPLNSSISQKPSHLLRGLPNAELLVDYSLYSMSSQLFVQTYPLYLSNRDSLAPKAEKHVAGSLAMTGAGA